MSPSPGGTPVPHRALETVQALAQAGKMGTTISSRRKTMEALPGIKTDADAVEYIRGSIAALRKHNFSKPRMQQTGPMDEYGLRRDNVLWYIKIEHRGDGTIYVISHHKTESICNASGRPI